MDSMNQTRFVYLVLLISIVLGFGFRFYQIDERPPWHDEVATRIFAAGYTPDEWRSALYTGEVFDVAEVQRFQQHNPSKSVLDSIQGLATDDPQHPPLYYALTRAWVSLFGDSVGALRALSAVSSLLVLPGLFWLARELFASTRVAWTAVALGAVSPFFVLYAQEAREYALWSALIVLCNASLLRALRLTEGGDAPLSRCGFAWGIYSISTTLALYTSFSSVTMILAQVLFLVIHKRGRVMSRTGVFSVTALGVSALLFLPWALALIRHWEAFQVSMRWSREIVIPTRSLLRILAMNTTRPVVDFWPELETAPSWVAAVLTVSLIVGAMVYLVRQNQGHARLLLTLLVVVPIGFLLLPDLLYGGIRSVSGRYMTPSWIGIELALAYLLGAKRSRWSNPWAAVLVTTLVAGIASCWSNARQQAVWTMGISYSLPEVATMINGSTAPLVIADNERHNPGNMMVLSNMLAPGTKMQFMTVEMQEGYRLPSAHRNIFLYSPIPPFRDQLQEGEGVRVLRRYEDLHLSLWELQWPENTP